MATSGGVCFWSALGGRGRGEKDGARIEQPLTNGQGQAALLSGTAGNLKDMPAERHRPALPEQVFGKGAAR